MAKGENQHFREGVDISEEKAICTHCKSHQIKCSGESPCSRCLKKYRTVGYIASCVYRKPNGYIERYFLKYYKPSQDGTNRAILLTEDELGRGEQYADRGISAARRSFNQTFPNGYETVHTRSDGFQCGLFAIQISLMHQFQLEIDIEALRQAHSTLSDVMAEFNMSNDGNFSLDQLVAILNAVPSPQRNNKRYSIGCILADCTAIIFPAAQGQGEPVVTLWIHNNENRSDSDVEVTGGILLLLRGNNTGTHQIYRRNTPISHRSQQSCFCAENFHKVRIFSKRRSTLLGLRQSRNGRHRRQSRDRCQIHDSQIV